MESLVQTQIFYEIAMSMGNSLDLHEMLKESLSVYLRRLNCSAGIVLEMKQAADRTSCFAPVFSIPRNASSLSAYQAALGNVPKDLPEAALAEFLQSLPLSGQDSNGRFFYVMELAGYGLLLLVRSRRDFNPVVIGSLAGLNRKLANSCLACLQNMRINTINRQLTHEMSERQQAEAELQEVLSGLELRIEERTRELKRANEALTVTIQALRRSEERYRELVENANSIILRMDKSGNVTFFNEFAQRFFGYSLDEILGRNTVGTIVPHVESITGRDLKRMIRDIGRNPDRYAANINENMRHNGDRVWIAWTNKPILNESGEVAEVLCIGNDITDRKRAEEALRVSERKFRAVFNQTRQFMGLMTLEGVVVEANRTALDFIGLEESEVLGKLFWETAWWKHSADQQERLRLAVQSAAKGEFVRFEATHPSLDGRLRYIDFSIKPVRDEAGNIVLLMPEGYDITERKLVEDALRESETRLSQIIDFLPDATFAIDTTGRVIAWNRAIEEMTGAKAQDIIGKGDYEYSVPFYAKRRPILIDLVLTSNEVIEKKYKSLKKEGDALTAASDVPIRGVNRFLLGKAGPLCDSKGNVVGAIESIRDISDRAAAESKLRAYADELYAINRIATACTSSLDLEGVLDRALEETLNIVGLEGGAICLVRPDRTLRLMAQRSLPEIQNPMKLGECLCGDCSEDGQPLILCDREAVLRHARRMGIEDRDVQLNVTYPLMIQRQCVGVLCLFTREEPPPPAPAPIRMETITAQIALGMQNALLHREVQQYAEKLEAMVRQRTAQFEIANEELEAFSYSVSHDLRAPLRGIDGWSQALMEDCWDHLDEAGRKFLDRIRSETRRMGMLIDGLLLLSRVTRSEMKREEVDLSALATSIAVRLRDSEPGRRVEFEIQERLTADGDARLLDIMLSNLLDNAWKFTSKHDSARIEFGRTENEGRRVWFVRDDGAGFDMAYSKRLFGAFQRMHRTSEFPGSGIGLATVQRIVHRHGGRVWATAQVEKGATIYFTLKEGT